MIKEQNLLELLDIYMDLVEKQDEIISNLSQIVKKQATEIQHLKNIDEYINFEEQLNVAMVEDVMEEYKEIKGEN